MPKLVYIASPYAGDIETNVNRARRYCRFAVSKNCIPFAPHLLYPQFMDDSDPAERGTALLFALAMLARCHELWVFGEWITPGMAGEIETAKELGVPIRYYDGRCEESTDKWK